MQLHFGLLERKEKRWSACSGPKNGRGERPGNLCGQAAGRVTRMSAVSQHADGAGSLFRIDFGWKVPCFRGGAEHFQCFLVHPGAGNVQFQVQASPEGVGTLCHYIEGVDAVNGDMPRCNHLGLAVVQIHPDYDVQLRVQVVKPSPALAATLQLLAWPVCMSLN